MNKVALIGRLTKQPVVKKSSSESKVEVAFFQLAVKRPVKAGQEGKADFPSIVVVGKQALNCEKYLVKGSLVAIEGRLQTGISKNEAGEDVFFTTVFCLRIEFLDHKDKHLESAANVEDFNDLPEHIMAGIPEGFQQLDFEDIPE